MAAGYNSLTVTRNGSTVSWSFNATAISSAYNNVRVVCDGKSAEAYTINTAASVQVTGSTTSDAAGSRTYTVYQYVRYGAGYDWQADGSTTVTVSWSARTYTVSYSANGGTGAPGSQTKTYGVTLTLSSTKPTRSSASPGSFTVTLDGNGGSVDPASLTAVRTTSYTFKNWNTASGGTGTSYSSGGSYTANAAATLYAQWNSSTTTAAVTLPTPTRGGYTFDGWHTAAEGGTQITGSSYTPTGNVTLYAHWTAKTFTVTFDGNGGTVSPGTKSVSYASAYGELPTPTRSGYTFLGWYTASTGGTQVTSETVANQTVDQTLYAHWESAAILHIVSSGTVADATQIYVVASGTVTQVTEVYSVASGVVKRGI